jgi:ribonuclease HII
MVKVIESLLIEAGITPLAGVDEAGRGACAGPLVIASVVLADPFAPELAKVRDSKDVSEAEREKLFDLVTSAALSISVITVPAAEVDSRGVHAANLDGMRRAVQGLSVTAYLMHQQSQERTRLALRLLVSEKRLVLSAIECTQDQEVSLRMRLTLSRLQQKKVLN